MVGRKAATRATAEYEDTSSAFRVAGSQYTQQFANLYHSRLKALSPFARARARHAWGEELPFVKTLDAEPGALVGVVGTLFADLGGKPDIMKEVTRDILAEVPAEVPGGKYVGGEGDMFSLEDECGRVALSGAGLAHAAFPFATGAVIAVRGRLDVDGTLVIDDVCLPGAPPAASTTVAPRAVAEAEGAHRDGAPPTPTSHSPGDKYVALVSGLQLGSAEGEVLPLVLLSEYLTGYIGSSADLAMQAAIVRLVVCGNSAAEPTNGAGSGGAAATAAAAASSDSLKKLERTDQRSLAECMAAVDTFFTSVCGSMPVDLMPGVSDPCNYLLPQQPLHPCLLPESSRLSTLFLCTNPHACSIGGVPFLGSSGQPVDDLSKYVAAAEEPTAVLRRTLLLRHLAPTAPDTLGCYPFSTTDPFVIRASPSVYFAGNQPCFASELCEAEGGAPVRLISVPDFATSQTIVLVNLRTLYAHTVAFGPGAGGDDDDAMEE